MSAISKKNLFLICNLLLLTVEVEAQKISINKKAFNICVGSSFKTTDVPVLTNPGNQLAWYSCTDTTHCSLAGNQPNQRAKPTLDDLNVLIPGLKGTQNTAKTYIFKVVLYNKPFTDTTKTIVDSVFVNYTVTALAQITLQGNNQDSLSLCSSTPVGFIPQLSAYSGTFNFLIQQFKASDNTPTSYTRTVSDSVKFTLNPMDSKFPIPSDNKYYYKLTISPFVNNNPCVSPKIIKFTVTDSPPIYFLFNRNQVYCPGRPVDFKISPDVFTKFFPIFYSYTFSFESRYDTTSVDITSQLFNHAILSPSDTFTYSYTFNIETSTTYQVKLVVASNFFSSSCNSEYAEEIRIGNPEKYTPQFKFFGLRRTKPTRLTLENDAILKPVNKFWYYDFFYAPFGSTFKQYQLDFDNFPKFSSSNTIHTYDLSGVYLVLYINSGTSSNGLDFCYEIYGSPLFIFDLARADSLSSWISSTYAEQVILSGKNINGVPLPNFNYNVIPTTRNSSWALIENPQDLDSKMQKDITGPVWMTQGIQGKYNNDEDSWVQSQFFQLDAMSNPNPFLSLKVWFDTEPRLDGAVLEYTLGDEEVWQRLGVSQDIENNPEWYNTQGLASAPGDQDGQNLGWSGDSQGWKTMRYSLQNVQEELIKKFPNPDDQVVRIRVSFASVNDTTIQKGVFAFGELKVADADRIALIEHFEKEENQSCPLDFKKDSLVLDMHYFPEPGHPFYNPDASSIRELYYGIGGDYYTVLDGQRGEGCYDSTQWNPDKSPALRLDSRKLDPTPFNISLNTPEKGKINVHIIPKTGFDAITQDTMLLHVAILQNGLSTNNKNYDRVVRQFLPGAEGAYVGFKDTNYVFDWNPNFTLPDAITDSTFIAVAFVQNLNSREVFQTAYRFIDAASVPSGRSFTEPGNPIQSIVVYPNPADRELNINPGENPYSLDHWEMRNLVGQTIAEGALKKGNTVLKQFDRLAEGIYGIFFYRQGELKAVKRIVIKH